MLLRVESDGVGRTLAIDVMDQRYLFDREVLESVDLYFKRSFWPDEVHGLAPELRSKVRPFGLNSPAISGGAAIRLLASRIHSLPSVRDVAVEARQLFALPPPKAFERSPGQPAEPVVLFQTRLWESDEPEVLAINEQRIRLVRTLRLALGRHFIGGLIPTTLARRHHQDLLTPLPYSMRAYPRLVRRALVGVYSQGLHRSLAFKLSEYLAASCCIVADCFEAVLPAPLEQGRHYLRFEDPDECAAACDRLLTNPLMATDLRRRNWDYYRAEVEPGAQMLTLLEGLSEGPRNR